MWNFTEMNCKVSLRALYVNTYTHFENRELKRIEWNCSEIVKQLSILAGWLGWLVGLENQTIFYAMIGSVAI